MKSKNILTVFIIIAIIGTFSYFVLYDSNPKVAELTVGDVSNPNFASAPLTKDQTTIIQLKIKNISDNSITNISVKAKPTDSRDGDVIEIINKVEKYPRSIEPGTTGTLDIQVKIVNVPTTTATEIVNMELFVNNISQGSKTTIISMKQ